MKDFFNLYSHGFIRAAVCVPEVRVADVAFNTERTIALAKEAAAKKALFALFPELGLSAPTTRIVPRPFVFSRRRPRASRTLFRRASW